MNDKLLQWLLNFDPKRVKLDPTAIIRLLMSNVDEETSTILSHFILRLEQTEDRKDYLKRCLMKALEVEP